MEEVEVDNNTTPRPQGSQKSKELRVIELSDEEEPEPYVTPYLLEKKTRKAVAPPPEDTEAEASETENQLRGKVSKKAAATSSNNLKVR